VLRRMRVPFIRRARLRRATGVEELFVVDLALSGVFVEREAPLPDGETVEVEFHLPENDTPIVARCRVAWWHPPASMLDFKDLPAGVGLEFVELPDEDQKRLHRYLSDYYRRDPRARRFVRHDAPEGEKP